MPRKKKIISEEQVKSDFVEKTDYIGKRNLFIVESPAKCKKIQYYLGNDFTVRASVGHIRDLKKGELSIDVHNNFTPTYENLVGKSKVISELRHLANNSDLIWLAPDEDREGEAIAWHLKVIINVPEHKIRRVTFNEITKTAILNSLQNYRNIDINLVDAQRSRRILDRLVGFELSPVLWKHFNNKLSAGRVQSVVSKMILEREQAIKDFTSEEYYKVEGKFIPQEENEPKITAIYNYNFDKCDKVNSYLETVRHGEFKINAIETKDELKNPPPPYTTSTLQQDINNKLHYPTKRIMEIAQKLYEMGLITYMRTDSVNLSNLAMSLVKTEIIEKYGEDYYKARKYANKSKGAQEAHECIRPTDMKIHTLGDITEAKMIPEGGYEMEQRKLYHLIWQRAMASQMVPAKYEVTKLDIVNNHDETDNLFVSKFRRKMEPGYLKIYNTQTDTSASASASTSTPDYNDVQEISDEFSDIISKFKPNDILNYVSITGKQSHTNPKPRFTEASLVRKLEERQIGRPSTYANMITVVMDRGYVNKKSIPPINKSINIIKLIPNEEIIVSHENKKIPGEHNKLCPTSVCSDVVNFLNNHFPTIMNYEFTANMEERLDEIALGDKMWVNVLNEFYNQFHPEVEVINNEYKEKNKISKVSDRRELGIDPNTKLPVFVLTAKYGPVVQLGKKNATFAAIQNDIPLEDITMEQALMFIQKKKEYMESKSKTQDESSEPKYKKFQKYSKYKKK